MTGIPANFAKDLGDLRDCVSIEEVEAWISNIELRLGLESIFLYRTGPLDRMNRSICARRDLRRKLEDNHGDMNSVITRVLQGETSVSWQVHELCGRDVGIGNQGWSVPFWLPRSEIALFSMTGNSEPDNWRDFLERDRQAIGLLAVSLFWKTLEFWRKSPVDGSVITEREKEAIALIAWGENRAMAALRLGITETTLRSHLDNARGKLGARNISHAIALAISTGLVLPPPAR